MAQQKLGQIIEKLQGSHAAHFFKIVDKVGLIKISIIITEFSK